MPVHSRANSWAGVAQPVSVVSYSTDHLQAHDIYGYQAAAASHQCKPQENALRVNWFESSTTIPQANSKTHSRTRSVPAITMPGQYLPIPYARPKPRPVSMNMENTVHRPPRTASIMGKSMTIKTSPLPVLPSAPNSIYNPRGGLQRRTSPTALSFSSSSISSTPPTMSPITPVSAVSYSSVASDEYYKPRVLADEQISAHDEQVYVLTLKTSDEIAQQMQTLRQKWFPADRLKVPAHITLFHALPASQITHITSLIESLSQSTPRFEISTGRITKSRTGVFVALDAGLDDTKSIFSKLRSQCWEFLSDQDKSFHRAHWTIQNKEKDSARVDEAFRDTHRLGTGLGWATGLALWKYESDGRWTKEREFGFVRCGREREDASPFEQEGDGWPIY